MQPHCLSRDSTAFDMIQIKKKYGYTGAPVTEDGRVGSKLIGKWFIRKYRGYKKYTFRNGYISRF